MGARFQIIVKEALENEEIVTANTDSSWQNFYCKGEETILRVLTGLPFYVLRKGSQQSYDGSRKVPKKKEKVEPKLHTFSSRWYEW